MWWTYIKLQDLLRCDGPKVRYNYRIRPYTQGLCFYWYTYHSLKHDQGGFVKEIPKSKSKESRGLYIYNPAYLCTSSQSVYLSAISAGTIFKSRRQILKHSIVLDRFMYRLNTENGGFTPDKSRGPKITNIFQFFIKQVYFAKQISVVDAVNIQRTWFYRAFSRAV